MLQISNTTIGIILLVALLAGSIAFLKSEIKTLKTDLADITRVAEEQGKSITQLKDDFNNLNDLDKNRSNNRKSMASSNAKMLKDSKKSDVVASKPKLVENQINKSFDMFAQDLQESTK